MKPYKNYKISNMAWFEKDTNNKGIFIYLDNGKRVFIDESKINYIIRNCDLSEFRKLRFKRNFGNILKNN